MRHCVILDSCFLVAIIDETDAFHRDARNIYNKLERSANVSIIVPPIAIYEVIASLMRRGFSQDKVEENVLYLLREPRIITLSIAETSAFRHAKTLLSPGSPANSLRTADFMIACIGLDFEAQILTFDWKVWKKVKPIYSKIYYCSEVGGHPDETSDFLNELELLSPRV